MCDAALPLVPHLLDAYGQYGEDPMGRKLGTVGAYFPDLYQTHETDLFIEYAWRDNLPGVTSLRAYKPAGNFDMVLLLQREAGGAAGIGIGAVIHSGD